ncbi:MAG: hypothetical protein ABSG43_29805, partial [Solirubrobacteraceae bacterium]
MLRAVEPHIARFGLAVALIAPGGLVLGLALASGGFFPDSVSVAVIIVIVIFSVRAVFSSTPFGGLSVGFSIVAVAMIGFTTLTLVSGSWSGSSARSTFAYNLALLYTAVLVLTGVLGRSAARARVMLYGLSAASVAISIASAATWLLPHLLPTASDV